MKSQMIVEEIYEAFGEGDIASILDALSEAVSWEVAGPAGEYPMFGRRHGRQGALEFFRLLSEHEDFSDFTPVRFHATRDTVVVEGRAALTLKKTGRPVAYDWVHVWTLKGGKVARFKEFYDTAQVVRAYRGAAALV
jgi:uncharacterized protein